MKSFYDNIFANTRYKDILEFDSTGLGIFSKISDPDIVVLYIPGGVKPLGLLAEESFQPNGFTWRWCNLWLERGVALAILDMPTEFYKNLSMDPMLRLKKERQQVINQVIEYLRKRFPNSCIGGYGHSYGSLEMSRLVSKEDLLDFVIIGSGNWNADPDKKAIHSNIFVKSLSAEDIKTRFCVVHHVNDKTSKCDYNAAKKIMNLTDSITVSGGIEHLGNPGLDPGPHFFTSQENEVIKNLIAWVRNKPYQHFIK